MFVTAELWLGREALLALLSMDFSWEYSRVSERRMFPQVLFLQRPHPAEPSVKFVWAQQLPAVTPSTAGAVPGVNTETAPLMVSIKH